MPRGTFLLGSRTSSPSVVAASKPTKDRMANTMPRAMPETPCEDCAGFSGAAVRPSAPPLTRMTVLSTRMTSTSAEKSTSAVRSELVIPSRDRKTRRHRNTAETMAHGMLMP